MMSVAKFSKPVAFNEKNEKDRLMLNYVKRRNFSGYVKKLIWADMSEKQEIVHTKDSEKVIKEVEKEKKVITIPAPQKPTAAERIERLKKQVKKQQTSPNPLPFISNQRKY